MKFEEALPMLKQGKKIRRAYWPERIYIKCENNEVVVVDNIWPEYFKLIFPADLLKNDWEIVK
jgi:hypothetical protein